MTFSASQYFLKELVPFVSLLLLPLFLLITLPLSVQLIAAQAHNHQWQALYEHEAHQYGADAIADLCFSGMTLLDLLLLYGGSAIRSGLGEDW